MRRLLLSLFVVGLLAAAPSGGLAAGGGTLVVDPAPLASVTLGCTFTISGSGYTAATSISFEVTGPRKATPAIHYFTGAEPVAAGGTFSETWTAWWSVDGAYQLQSWWRDSKGATHKGAVVKFTAVPAAPCA
jgi:hypothetical protein